MRDVPGVSEKFCSRHYCQLLGFFDQYRCLFPVQNRNDWFGFLRGTTSLCREVVERQGSLRCLLSTLFDWCDPSSRVPVNSIAVLNVRFNSWLLIGSLGDGGELLCVFQSKCWARGKQLSIAIMRRSAISFFCALDAGKIFIWDC